MAQQTTRLGLVSTGLLQRLLNQIGLDLPQMSIKLETLLQCDRLTRRSDTTLPPS